MRNGEFQHYASYLLSVRAPSVLEKPPPELTAGTASIGNVTVKQDNVTASRSGVPLHTSVKPQWISHHQCCTPVIILHNAHFYCYKSWDPFMIHPGDTQFDSVPFRLEWVGNTQAQHRNDTESPCYYHHVTHCVLDVDGK